MVTAGTLVSLLGICLLIASGTSLLLRMGSQRARRLVERTAITPVATWRPGQKRVAALGTVDFGPGGPVSAPVSQVECAWYRIRLVRSPSRSRDESPPPEDILFTLAAPDPPALSDRSGTVLIDPALLVEAPNLDDPLVPQLAYRVLGSDPADPIASLVPRQFLDDVRKGETLQLWEIRLVAGRQVYALGSAGRRKGSIMLKPARHGLFTVFTTDERSTVIERRRTNAAEARGLAILLGKAGMVITAAGSLILYLAV